MSSITTVSSLPLISFGTAYHISFLRRCFLSLPRTDFFLSTEKAVRTEKPNPCGAVQMKRKKLSLPHQNGVLKTDILRTGKTAKSAVWRYVAGRKKRTEVLFNRPKKP